MSSLLKFTCKDTMCRNAIPIGDSEIDVECPECGIRYDQSALQDAEPVFNCDEMKKKIFVRIYARYIPKRGPESVKVNGLSNFYCKLLSPLLTNYGMDTATGQVLLLTEMNMGDILDCSIFKDRAFLIDPSQLSIVGFGRDVSGSMNYLSGTLNSIKEFNNGEERLVPIYTDGDGHCLVHAISRALLGRELFWHPLRCCLKRHFELNLVKYQELFKDFVEPEDWKAIIEESDPEFKPPEGELHGLRNVHIFGLANVLKRPIILLDSLECMKKCGDYSALFLPGFVPPEDCRGKDNSLNKPICIAWSSYSHNHYIPLVGIQKKPLPVLPEHLIPKVWGMPQSEFRNYIELDAKGNCVIGGGRVLSENYIQRLVNAMENLFLEKKGVHPRLVADAKLYFCSEPAYLNIKLETLIEHSKMYCERDLLYRCLFCKSLCKYNINHSLYSPGGYIYNILFETYKNFNTDLSYKVPSMDFSCKYDPIKNEFFPDVTTMERPQCNYCARSDVRRVRPDGTLDNSAGDESCTGNYLLVSSQESSSLVNKILESNAASSLENKLLVNRILDSEIVSSQENKMSKTETVSSQSSKLVKDESAGDNSDMINIELKWKGKTAHHSISVKEFNKLGCATIDCVKTLASDIAAKHFPSESRNVEFDMYLSDEIWNQVTKLPPGKLKSTSNSPVKEDINEKENTSEESFVNYADTTVTEPQYVKVVTSMGQQGNLTLSKKGISYCQLQDWIATEFKIPAKNQKIKWGFPPKEFEVPTDVNEQNLPLKHLDRLMVENDSLSVSEKKNYLNNTPDSVNYTERFFAATKYSPDIFWRVVKHEPDLFTKGGTLFETAAEKQILCDGDHISIPYFPTKKFCYNATTNSLELCVKPLGHFQISGDIDERIECVKKGQFISGVKSCPQMGRPAKEAVISRPIRKPIKSSPEENLPSFRKGPGYSVLSKRSEEMDFS